MARQAAIVGVGVGASVVVAAVARDKPSIAFRLSLGTGYASLLLLAASLALGPLRILAGRRSPPSSDLRRDVGVWAAIFAIAHVVTGLQVHMGGAIWKYFLDPRHAPGRLLPRLDGFGLANHTGLVATLVLVALVAISNDAALRRLGVTRWKAIQRWNYAGAVLVLLHGFAYIALDRRSPGFVITFAVIVAATGLLQLAGVRHVRRSRSRDAR